MRVLIADDDPIALDAPQAALTDGGTDVACARDGREALELLGRGPCQILITDWEMPELDGIALCQAVRRGQVGHFAGGGYVYIILLTSHGTTAERVRGLSAGGPALHAQPVQPPRLPAPGEGPGHPLRLRTRGLGVFAFGQPR